MVSNKKAQLNDRLHNKKQKYTHTLYTRYKNAFISNEGFDHWLTLNEFYLTIKAKRLKITTNNKLNIKSIENE